ncbi:MAG: hypothetical protein OEZ34_16870 [Spirochaetia bacterium]|nr:hypothetical protein [Spirochaetia bacterium]
MKNQKFLIMSVLILLSGISELFFTGKWPFFLAPWLLTAALLSFFRKCNEKKYFFILIAVLWTAAAVSQDKMSPLPRPMDWIFILIAILYDLISFYIDRKLSPRFHGWIRSMILPVSAVSFESLWNTLSPSSTIGKIAYTQFSFSYLIQSADLFGIYGITFIIYWFSSVITGLIESEFNIKEKAVLIPVLAWSAVFLSLMFYGMIRLNLPLPEGGPVKISSITVKNLKIYEESYRAVFQKSITIPDTAGQSDPAIQEASKGFLEFISHPERELFIPVNKAWKDIEDEAFRLASEEAAEGAKIVFFSEAQFFRFAGDEERFHQRLSHFAEENQIFLFLPAVILDREKLSQGGIWMKNQIWIYGPDGKRLYIYNKAKPIPGIEPVAPGDGKIPVVEIEGLRVGAVICYDADFPSFMLQSGRKELDVLLVPSGDWHAITPVHSYMAVFRGIENGLSIVRQANFGLSVSADSRGRILSQMNFFQVKKRVLRSVIKTKRKNTLYALTGNIFPIFSVIVLILLIILFFKFKIRSS